MNKSILLCILVLMTSSTPVEKYGKLRVQGNQLVSASGQAVQLKGMSTHGPQWFQNCYTYQSFQHLALVWKVDVIRIAMYVNEQGYNTNPAYWKGKINEMVGWAESLGVYALIDWHVLNPGNPDDGSYWQSEDFWSTMSSLHNSRTNVLYEIANEPNGVDWNTIVNYHNRIINVIRQHDPNTVIICGTPNWSSDFNSIYPLSFNNLMYSLHFYAASHKVSDDIRRQAAKYPIFVTEFGTCTHTGGGQLDLMNAQAWMNFMNGGNDGGQKISYINWSFSEANESCAALYSGACNQQNWYSLTESGLWVKQRMG